MYLQPGFKPLTEYINSYVANTQLKLWSSVLCQNKSVPEEEEEECEDDDDDDER